MATERLQYRVHIPEVLDMYIPAYSDRQALSQAVFRAMKDKGYLWYLDTEYLGEHGARNMAARILEDSNWQRYIQLVGPEGKPIVPQPEKKPEQMELNIGGTTHLKQWVDEEACQVLSSLETVLSGQLELSVTWPSTGRKITYTSLGLRDHLIAVAEKAKAKKASMVLRVHQLPGSVTQAAVEALGSPEDLKITKQIHDGILWRKGKVSVKAIEQFRKYSNPEWQAVVDRLVRGKKIQEAIDAIRPYMAYQVQAAGEGAQAKVIAVDFDGVLAKHDPDNNTMQQEPIDGAIEALNHLVDNGYEVTIFSCRANKEEGQNEIKDWLQRFGGPDLPVTGSKPSADAYVDDKAIKFLHWEDALEKVKSQKKLSSLICEEDGTVMSLGPNKQSYICPACDTKKTLAEASILTIYAFTPGDMVHVKSIEGTTLGDAYLLYKASVIEERALKASNLWMVKFVSGECLPVSEQYLMKTGFDNERRLEAESVMLGEALIEPEEDTTLKYDLDKVIEETLQEVQEAILPADAILVAMASRYVLSADDMDTLAEHVAELDKVEEEVTPEKVDLVAAATDAVEEADAFFEDAKRVPSEDDELALVVGYLAEEFGWADEAITPETESRVKEVVAQVREASKQTPRWVTAEDKAMWEEAKKKAGEGGINGTLAVFRTMSIAAGAPEALRDLKYNRKPTSWDEIRTLTEEELTPEVKDAINGLSHAGNVFGKTPIEDFTGPVFDQVFLADGPDGTYLVNTEGFDYPRYILKFDPAVTTAEIKEYVPVTTPSLTSVPEGEYDVVRQQTVAVLDTSKLVILPPSDVFVPDGFNDKDSQDELDEIMSYVKVNRCTFDGTPGRQLMNLSPEILERIEGLFPCVTATKVPLEEFIKNIKKWESKANTKTAGTWSVPNTKAKATALVSYLDSLKSTKGDFWTTKVVENKLYNLIGDDDLFDQLDAASEVKKDMADEPVIATSNALTIIITKIKEWLSSFDPSLWSDKWDSEALSILKSYVSGVTSAMEHKHTCPYCDNQWPCGNDPQKCTINPSWPCANCLKVKETKTSTLQKTLEGVRLDAESKRIVASIFEDIMLYEDHFLSQAGQFFTYEWDPGASWEVRDIAGKKQIVRKEPAKKETKTSKHAFQEGQLLKYHAAFFPVEVKVTALLGNDRYKIKSMLDGNVYDVGEDELFLPEDGAAIFG